jgi:hypothetical protein
MLEVAHTDAVDEDAHVRPQQVLLVDHAKTQPGVAAVEVLEHLVQRVTDGLDLRPARVRTQGARNQHLHRPPPVARIALQPFMASSATSTA